MSINKNLLTNADNIAIDLNDSNYINNKGVKNNNFIYCRTRSVSIRCADCFLK